MLTKTLLSAALAASAFCGLSAAAFAQESSPADFDACDPEAWDQFAYAVEHRDYDLLAQMSNAQYSNCEFYQTAQLLYCQENPLACIQPASGGGGGDNPNDNPTERPLGPFPGQAPGQGVGEGGGDGGDGGGNVPVDNNNNGGRQGAN